MKNFIELFNCFLEKYKLDNQPIEGENAAIAERIFV